MHVANRRQWRRKRRHALRRTFINELFDNVDPLPNTNNVRDTSGFGLYELHDVAFDGTTHVTRNHQRHQH